MIETITDTQLGQPCVGYGVFAFIDKNGREAIEAFRGAVEPLLPEGLLWRTPKNVLHTTVFEIAMAYRKYDEDEDAWFKKREADITSKLSNILHGIGPIVVRFNEIEVSPSAIIIKGHDDGSFDAIRKQVVDAGIIMPGSRTPPDIIHSSLFRYNYESDLEQVQEAVKGHTVDFSLTVSELLLERIGIVPMGDLQTIATFEL